MWTWKNLDFHGGGTFRLSLVSRFTLICVSVTRSPERPFSSPHSTPRPHQLQRCQPQLCYLSIYLAAGVKWLSDKLECNDNDRNGEQRTLLTEQRREFPPLLSLILIRTYFTPSQCEWQLVPPPTWMGVLNFVFFFPSSESWRGGPEADRGLGLKGTIRGRAFFFHSLERRGSRIKMRMTFAISGGLLCASHWCAFSQSEPANGGGDLHCKLAAHWPFSQVDRRARARFPHTSRPSFYPGQTPKPPHSPPPPPNLPPNLSSSKGP